MREFYSMFRIKPTPVKWVVIFFLILESATLFPIVNQIWGIYYLVLIYLLYMTGLILAAVYGRNWYKSIILIISTLSIGFFGRILIEWGETSLNNDLSVFNIMITYLPMILIIFSSYKLTLYSYYQDEKE